MGDYDLDTEKIKKSMESGMRTLENGFQKLSNDVKMRKEYSESYLANQFHFCKKVMQNMKMHITRQ